MSEEEENILNNNVKKKIASIIIKKNTISETNVIRAEICDHKLKLTLLNFLIIIFILILINRFLIQPIFFKHHTHNSLKFHHLIKKYFNKYTDSKNLFLFIIFLLIICIFLSLNVIELQNIGIILLMTFVTAIAQEGKEYLLGAILSGITAYVFIRLKTYFSSNNYKLYECDDDIITLIKRKFKWL
jgi:hypothetical protein